MQGLASLNPKQLLDQQKGSRKYLLLSSCPLCSRSFAPNSLGCSVRVWHAAPARCPALLRCQLPGLAAVGTRGAEPQVPWDSLQEDAGVVVVVAELSHAEDGEHVLSHRFKSRGARSNVAGAEHLPETLNVMQHVQAKLYREGEQLRRWCREQEHSSSPAGTPHSCHQCLQVAATGPPGAAQTSRAPIDHCYPPLPH